jgi:hypothetical protein
MRLATLLLAAALTAPALAGSLEDTLGRNDTRVLSAPFRIVPGKNVQDLGLVARMESLVY